MATVCSEGGRYLSDPAIMDLEKSYIAYREAYNCSVVALILKENLPSSGLSLWAVDENRALFTVRPKQHYLEHLILGKLFKRFCRARILDYAQIYNPKYIQCMLDEDMIHRATRP